VPLDVISYLLAKEALRKGIRLPTLKDLVIDTDKDWQGHRIMNLGEPIDPNDAARKIYVDVATTGLGINYYLLDAADSEVSAYKQLSLTPPELSEAYVEVAQNSAGDYEIASWIAPADGIPVLRLGVYTLHFQAERVSGNIDVRFFFRLYERDSEGNETLIAESSLSDLVADRRDVVVSLVLAHDYIMSEGSRLVLKIYARYLSSGPSTTVRLYYQGAVRSRLATPIAKEILDNIYAGITHASRHALGGPDELSLDASQIVSGVLSADRIPDLDASKITSGVLDLARIPNIDWSRIAGNFPRDISDLISSAFSRSWISDFFSAPFWDNIPDKPSAFPPEAHASRHALGGEDELSLDASQITSGTLSVNRIPSLPRSKISDFFSSPFWDNIPDKPSTFPPSSHTHSASDITSGTLNLARLPLIPASKLDFSTWEKVAEVNVSSDCNYVELSGLDINTDKFYVLFASITNPTSDRILYYICAEGHNSESEYYHAELSVYGDTISAKRGQGYPLIARVEAGVSGLAVVFITLDSLGRYRHLSIQTANESTIDIRIDVGVSTFTLSNLTTLTIRPLFGNIIGAGSKFILCRVRTK